jgi:hypothetical protein
LITLLAGTGTEKTGGLSVPAIRRKLAGTIAGFACAAAASVFLRAAGRKRTLLAVLGKYLGFTVNHSFPPCVSIYARPTDALLTGAALESTSALKKQNIFGGNSRVMKAKQDKRHSAA